MRFTNKLKVKLRNRFLSLMLVLSMCFTIVSPDIIAYAVHDAEMTDSSFDNMNISSSDENDVADIIEDNNQAEETYDEDMKDDELFADNVILTAENDDVNITISGDADVMDKVTDISVEDISESRTADYEEYLNSLNDGYVYTVLGIFNITLFDEDNNEIEPDGDVQVSFTGDIVAESISSVSTNNLTDKPESFIEVYHNAMPDEDDISLDNMSVSVDSDNSLSFATDGFSEYALILKEGSTTQKELGFGDDSWLESDKYLEITGERNGQNTYDIYLEQAYYDESGDVISVYAPARSDIVLAIDCSSSMGPFVDNLNNGLYSLLQEIYNVNSHMEQNAKDGVYIDINPSSLGNEAALKSVLKNHYVYINAEALYNSEAYTRHDWSSNPLLIRTESDIQSVYNQLKISSDDISIGTRTDLGTKQLLDIVSSHNYTYTYNVDGQTVTHNSAICMLFTDGNPTDNTRGSWRDSYKVANNALTYAYQLKNTYDAALYSVYMPASCYYDATVQKALKTGEIMDIDITSRNNTWMGIFLSLWSSDYKKNGSFKLIENGGDVLFDLSTKQPWSYEETIRDHFGKHIYINGSFSGIENIFVQFVKNISTNADSITNNRGYLGSSTVIIDEITDPFSVDSSSDINVYAVPRIPENLDSDGRPTDMDSKYNVSSFRWGEQLINSDGNTSTEWINVTDMVSVDLRDNVVTVTGWDFEANSVTNFDKDIKRYGISSPGGGEWNRI